MLDHREVPLADWDENHSLNTVRHPPIQLSSIPGVPLACEDAETQGVKRIIKYMHEVSTRTAERLSPIMDPPCASEKLRKGRQFNH
jgi:hypothetical protein